MTTLATVQTIQTGDPSFPDRLRSIPAAPTHIHTLGNLENALSRPTLAVVGSRKVSAYGRAVTLQLARAAAERGITIISGLALGIDSIAHQGALEGRGTTIAVLPCGLDRIYPASHRGLATTILRKNGVLVSEYPFNTAPYKTNFLARNRIIAGLADAVLITEAAERSGSINTANHALEQGRIVMAVPGNITSELSTGTNNLIKAGATPVTSIDDILYAMKIEAVADEQSIVGDTAEQTQLLQLIAQGISDIHELQLHSNMQPQLFNQTLTMLEITARIQPLGSGKWSIR